MPVEFSTGEQAAAYGEAKAKIDVVRAWGGGLVASADGARFTVPVQTLHAGSNPRYGL